MPITSRLWRVAIAALLIQVIYLAQAFQVDSTLIIALVWLLLLSTSALILYPPIVDDWPIKLFCLVSLLICLGLPTDGWDARSIWMFHAHRIYLDGALYAQMDNYANWSHNAYPSLVPAVSAALAHTIGLWNEIFPKSALVLTWIPALMLIAVLVRESMLQLLVCVFVLLFARAWLFNGYMDAGLSLMFAATLMACWMFFVAINRGADKSEVWPLLLVMVSFIASLTLMKNEGLVLALLTVSVVLGTAYFSRLLRRPALFVGLVIIALLPVVAWKITLAQHGVSDGLTDSNMAAQLALRLHDSSTIKLLAQTFAFKVLTAAVLIGCGGYFAGNRPLLIVVALSASLYTMILFAVYLGTPHDLTWHLNTSFRRTIQPVIILSAVYFVIALSASARKTLAIERP